MQNKPGFATLLGGLALASLSASAQPASNASGHWEGTLQAPNQQIGITVDLAKNDTGLWTGSLSIPQANALDIPIEKISVEEPAVHFVVSGFPGSPLFEGKLSDDGGSLAGTATARDAPIPFQLKRTGNANVKLPPPASALSKDFEGAWEGTLDAGGTQLRLVLNLKPAADGTATGTLTSVDQGNQQIPVTTVSISDKQLKLEVRAVAGTFVGTLEASGEIAGNWTQGPNSLPLTFKRASTPTP